MHDLLALTGWLLGFSSLAVIIGLSLMALGILPIPYAWRQRDLGPAVLEISEQLSPRRQRPDGGA